jgi:RHS repeat-associated protein
MRTVGSGYDDIDQLTSESRSGFSASYTYDANGNRLTRTVNSVTENYYYDDADKLDEIKVGGSTVKDFSYDAAGRTTSVVTGAGTTTLAYDYESRITTITFPNTSTNTFTYNGLDTRVGKVDSGGTKTYKRDGVGVTAPVLSDGGASDTPGLSERRSGTSTFSHAGIKNQHEQTAANESSAATQTYDAFGNLVGSSGTWKGPFGYGGSFGYQTDGDSGLKLLGHRYYDSSTGRFLTRDPAKDGRNWYVYCDNDPTTGADPLGQYIIKLAWHHVMFNQWHSFVIVIDNDPNSKSFGKKWGFSGGPTNDGIWALLSPGPVKDFSGPYDDSHYDSPKRWKNSGWVLTVNELAVGPLLDFLDRAKGILPVAGWEYSFTGKNSNTFAHMIVDAISLHEKSGTVSQNAGKVVKDIELRKGILLPGWERW